MNTTPVYIYLAAPAVLSSASHLLDETEHRKAGAFKFNQDRDHYIAAHALLRLALSQHAPVDPSKWRFQHNAYGKPSIQHSAYQELQFNLSHTQELVGCAIHSQWPLGFDIECHKPLPDLNSLMEYAFSPMEVQAIRQYPTGFAQEQRFFNYWTLKEAYIKAQGQGLSIPLQSFSFYENAQGWQLNPTPSNTWYFHHEKYREHHQWAIAIHTECSANQDLILSITTVNSLDSSCWSINTSTSLISAVSPNSSV